MVLLEDVPAGPTLIIKVICLATKPTCTCPGLTDGTFLSPDQVMLFYFDLMHLKWHHTKAFCTPVNGIILLIEGKLL